MKNLICDDAFLLNAENLFKMYWNFVWRVKKIEIFFIGYWEIVFLKQAVSSDRVKIFIVIDSKNFLYKFIKLINETPAPWWLSGLEHQ